MRAPGPVPYMGPAPIDPASSGDGVPSFNEGASPSSSPGQPKRKGRGRGKKQLAIERIDTKKPPGAQSSEANSIGQIGVPGGGVGPAFFNQGVPQFRGRMPMHQGATSKMGPQKNPTSRMPGLYHNPMDPSPSGGGAINVTPDTKSEPPSDGGPKEKGSFPPGMRYPGDPNAFSMSSPPRHPYSNASRMPPAAASYSPSKNPQNFATPYQTSPSHPPSNYPPYANTSPSQLPPGGGLPVGYVSHYQNSPNMYADFAASGEENSDSNTSGGRFEEEVPPPPLQATSNEGEFGGLVSYFSSQREDDMDP